MMEHISRATTLSLLPLDARSLRSFSISGVSVCSTRATRYPFATNALANLP
jgi:hypothetical protein